jgi:uncharacterized protein YybS (DUF2232 family)
MTTVSIRNCLLVDDIVLTIVMRTFSCPLLVSKKLLRSIVASKERVELKIVQIIYSVVYYLYLLQNGFSIGIGDTIADEATMNHITKTITDAKER